jgi:hypothetical protein
LALKGEQIRSPLLLCLWISGLSLNSQVSRHRFIEKNTVSINIIISVNLAEAAMGLLGAIFILVVAILIISSITFGIFLARILIRNNQNIQPKTNVSIGDNTQLDRIERAIREGTCLGILAISIAAIVAAGTVNVDLGWRVLLYFVGGAGIVYSIIRFYFRRN